MSSFCRASETWMERLAHQKTILMLLWVVFEEQDVPFRFHLSKYYKSTFAPSRCSLTPYRVKICILPLSCNLWLCRRIDMVGGAHSTFAAFRWWPCCHCWKTLTKTADRGLKHKSQQVWAGETMYYMNEQSFEGMPIQHPAFSKIRSNVRADIEMLRKKQGMNNLYGYDVHAQEARSTHCHVIQ